MKRSTRVLKRLAVCASAIAVVAALGAASASAASWSSGYPIQLTGSVTFERNDGVGPVTCQLGVVHNSGSGLLPFDCPNADPQFGMKLTPATTTKEGKTTYFVGFMPTPLFQTSATNPWGDAFGWTTRNDSSTPANFGASFTNGSISEPSYMTLNNVTQQRVRFGSLTKGGILTASVWAKGDIDVTTPTGGLVTIVP